MDTRVFFGAQTLNEHLEDCEDPEEQFNEFDKKCFRIADRTFKVSVLIDIM